MNKCFQIEDTFIKKIETRSGNRTINYMDEKKLEKFMKSECPYNTILFKKDESFDFNGISFKGTFLSFKTDEPINFTECNFERDMIIRNEGMGTINLVKCTIGSKKETKTGTILAVTNSGNLVLDQVNDVMPCESSIKLRATEGIVYMHDVTTDTPIVVSAKMLHVDDCNANIELHDVKRLIGIDQTDDLVPRCIRKKGLSR